MTDQLLVFGPGYSAKPVIERAIDAGWSVFATYRDTKGLNKLSDAGVTPVAFDSAEAPSVDPQKPLHILTSIAPKQDTDPVLPIWKSWLNQQNIKSTHYLSSTNVYGDRGGDWVDETTAPTPSLARGKRRLEAEGEWQRLAQEKGYSAFIYRLAGIYGPGRNAFASLKNGKARCIIKEGQVFGRIHRDDICQTVWTAMTGTHPGGIFNLADDMPTPPHEVIETAASMMGIEAPARENWEDAEMSEMARSFYLESKRVRNDKIKQELSIELIHPNYKEGLKSLFEIDGNC